MANETLMLNSREDRWTYLVSAFDPLKGELICVLAGKPSTAEYVSGLFKSVGLARVQWKDAAKAAADQ